ncbi:MAG TPA: class I SAM-dependent methyltransferase [Bacteroidales bacterium]|nr:class I SAM-dependent methyltransferase [Bacteroidales bacterium]HOX73766.1 class I SAM-dependent methyltransferase [Bacteroidales bacterium]
MYPETFARFYDLIYHQMRDHVDLDFFLDEIDRTRGRILEVGSGTGRLFTNALLHGADIFGIDISESMLKVLKSKIKPDDYYRVSNQNILDFRFDFKFDLIIAPFRVIMHVDKKEEQLRALNNVYNHLNNNGKLIFDTFIPDLGQLINGLKDVVDFEGEYEKGRKVRRIVSTKPDLINQIINVNFRMEWDENGTLKTKEWKIPMRYFFRYELEHLVERSDFGKYKIIGDYQGNELNNNSKEFIVICTK